MNIFNSSPRQLSTAEKAKIKAVFQRIDSDDSGTLDSTEVAVALSEMEMPADEATVKQLFRSLDSDGNNAITLQEFEAACFSIQNSSSSVFSDLLGLEMGVLGLGTLGAEGGGDFDEDGEVFEATVVTASQPFKKLSDWPPLPPEVASFLAFAKMPELVLPFQAGGVKSVQQLNNLSDDQLKAEFKLSMMQVKRLRSAITNTAPTEPLPPKHRGGGVSSATPPRPPQEPESPKHAPPNPVKASRAITLTGGAKKPSAGTSKKSQDARKKMTKVRTDVKALPPSEEAKAKKVFQRIDFDNSGSLDKEEVQLALIEMGLDATCDEVASLIAEYDADGDGVIELEEFYAIFANTPLGDFDFSHVDFERMRRIEQAAAGVGHAHEGYNECAAFFRRVSKGVHVLRLSRQGLPSKCLLHLTPDRSGLMYQYTSTANTELPFSALRAVAQPFRDEHDDTLGLVPPQLATRTLVLVFAALPSDTYALELDRKLVKDKDRKSVSADAALELASRFVSPQALEEACHTHGRAALDLASQRDGAELLVTGPVDEAALSGSLSGVEPLSAAKGTRAGGTKPKPTKAVLVLVCDTPTDRKFLVEGLILAMKHWTHHVEGAGGVDRAGSPRSPGSARSPRSPGGSAPLSPKMDLHSAGEGVGGALSLFHQLYRPHHHKNYPPARFHVGVIAEVNFYTEDSPYKLSMEWTTGGQVGHAAAMVKAARKQLAVSSARDRLEAAKGRAAEEEEEKEEGGQASKAQQKALVESAQKALAEAEAMPTDIQSKPMPLPNPVFRPNMYLRAKILSYDKHLGTYDLEYVDGPYVCDENPDGAKLFPLKGKLVEKEGTIASYKLRGVNRHHVTVDLYDNYGSHWPLFLLFISLLQIAAFVYYTVWVAIPKGESLGMHTPVSGPEWTWMRIIGDFPDCENLSKQYHRFFTYQFVHAGLSHIAVNILLQVVFGLPLNMVHGSWRFGLIYEIGVCVGALTFVCWDGGQYSLVGCSGGVYCIFGMHVAEIVTNWSLEKRGLLNHWMRMFIMILVLGGDAYMYVRSPSETTSHSAHAGGLVIGYLCGIIFLDNLETTCWHRYVGWPLSVFFAVLLPVAMAMYYLRSPLPPSPLGSYFLDDTYDDPPCCFSLRECDDVPFASYDSAFYCTGVGDELRNYETTALISNGDCSEMEATASAAGFT